MKPAFEMPTVELEDFEQAFVKQLYKTRSLLVKIIPLQHAYCNAAEHAGFYACYLLV